LGTNVSEITCLLAVNTFKFGSLVEKRSQFC